MQAGFTLVEVVLAIAIAIGILTVALYFHHQSAQLRGQLIDQSEQIAATRLLMERLTTDLRTACSQPQVTFVGSNTFLRFAKLNVSSPSRGSNSNQVPTAVGSDLTVVSYEVGSALKGTNLVITGIHRTEQPFQTFVGSQSSVLTVGTNTAVFDGFAPTNRVRRPITDRVHYLSLGYWDGFGWKERWSSSHLPQAVRITMGWSALAEGATEAEYGGELFRRVVVLPGYGASPESREDLLGPSLRGEVGPDNPDEGLYLPSQ